MDEKEKKLREDLEFHLDTLRLQLGGRFDGRSESEIRKAIQRTER